LKFINNAHFPFPISHPKFFGEVFKERAVAWFLSPEGAEQELVAAEGGVGTGTLKAHSTLNGPFHL
jgi:hypothetical protein